VVEVDEHEGGSLSGPLGVGDNSNQHLPKAATIGQTGQVVVKRLVPELPTPPSDDKVIGEQSG
jgi:hypothetical protein